MASEEPAAMKRPSLIAKASTNDERVSAVNTLPLRTTRSAVWAEAAVTSASATIAQGRCIVNPRSHRRMNATPKNQRPSCFVARIEHEQNPGYDLMSYDGSPLRCSSASG